MQIDGRKDRPRIEILYPIYETLNSDSTEIVAHCLVTMRPPHLRGFVAQDVNKERPGARRIDLWEWSNWNRPIRAGGIGSGVQDRGWM